MVGLGGLESVQRQDGQLLVLGLVRQLLVLGLVHQLLVLGVVRQPGIPWPTHSNHPCAPTHPTLTACHTGQVEALLQLGPGYTSALAGGASGGGSESSTLLDHHPAAVAALLPSTAPGSGGGSSSGGGGSAGGHGAPPRLLLCYDPGQPPTPVGLAALGSPHSPHSPHQQQQQRGGLQEEEQQQAEVQLELIDPVGGVPAAVLPGTQQCRTHQARDMLHSLGGITVLLPLFALLDSPLQQQQQQLLLQLAGGGAGGDVAGEGAGAGAGTAEIGRAHV